MKVIKLSMNGCGPCKAYAPIFDKWAEENPDIESESINVSSQIIDKSWNIKNLPTTIMLNYKDELVGKKLGFMSEKQLQAFVDEHPED